MGFNLDERRSRISAYNLFFPTHGPVSDVLLLDKDLRDNFHFDAMGSTCGEAAGEGGGRRRTGPAAVVVVVRALW